MHNKYNPNLSSKGIIRQTYVLTVFLFFTLLAFPQASYSAPTYSSLSNEFKTLSAHSKKSGLRESWEKMQTKFNKFVKTNPKSNDAPKAAFMAACCMEEIAVRTFNPIDFTMATLLFGEVGDNYPRTFQGEEALYKKAEIEFSNLKNPEASQKTIDKLLKISRNEGLKKRTRKLETKVRAAPPAKQETTASSASKSKDIISNPKPNASKEKSKPAQSFVDPTLVSITIDANNKVADAEIELSSGAGYSWSFIPKAKTQSGQAALIIEVEGVVPNKGITGFRSISKGPVKSIRVAEAKVKTAKGRDVPSCRVEFTLRDNYRTEIKTERNTSKILIKIISSKKQTSTANGRGVAGRIKSTFSASQSTSARSSSSASKAEMLGLTVKTILLDPGHGGRDPGAQGNGITESKMVLKISKLVETKLKKNGFQVSYTRENDVFIPLEKRTETANRRKVDLFVSIHINANNDSSVAGIETYYLDRARTKSAELVAARENGVTVAAIDDLQVILTDLGLSTKMTESRELAKDVQKNMESKVKAGGFTVRSNGVRSGPFYVLMGAKMPAILIEVGYCSNKNDTKYLKNDKYLNRIADGIVDGIVAYKKRIESSVG